MIGVHASISFKERHSCFSLQITTSSKENYMVLHNRTLNWTNSKERMWDA